MISYITAGGITTNFNPESFSWLTGRTELASDMEKNLSCIYMYALLFRFMLLFWTDTSDGDISQRLGFLNSLLLDRENVRDSRVYKALVSEGWLMEGGGEKVDGEDA